MYRPFALLAFAATVAMGTPLGIRMLFWLYLGASAVSIEWVLLHAHLQIFGFFGALITGVAHHLIPRFTGRPVVRPAPAPWLVGLLGGALLLRISGTWTQSPALILVASLLQAAAFTIFGSWVWRSLDPPHLGFLRWHLTVSAGWLAAACLIEAGLRWRGLGSGLAVPDLGAMRAVHGMGLYGGVVGWVLGVLLRAGPMFIPGWNVPPRVALAVPWMLGLGISITVMAEMGEWSAPAGTALARLGDTVALAAVGAVIVAGGAFKRGPGALPMLSRSPHEARMFRLAVASAVVAPIGMAIAAASASGGGQVHLLTDALRHLVTVGFLTSVVVAMAFRLITVLESTVLPWPRLRSVAFWALLLGVLLRSAEALAGWGWPAVAPWVPLSGVLVWTALACVGVNLVGAIVGAQKARGNPLARPGG